MKYRAYIIFHKYLYKSCYEGVSEESMQNLSFFSVNRDIEKTYDPSFDAQVLKEWEQAIYNPSMQKSNYCETSVYFHLAANSETLVEPYDYIGCFQYDMKFRQETFDMIRRVFTEEYPYDKDIVFYLYKEPAYIFLGSSVVGPDGEECLNHTGYIEILQRYNEMFGTSHAYCDLVYEDIFQFHAFLLHKEQFYKVVQFIVNITPFVMDNLKYRLKHIPYTFDTIWGFVLMLQKRENPRMKWIRLPGIEHRDDLKDHAWKDKK
jgi:hypothetical protein